VLGYLDEAVRIGAPLPEALQAASFSERGRLAHQLGLVRWHLERGATVGAAMRSAAPVLAGPAGIVEAGERLGRLPRALDRALRRAQDPVADDGSDRVFWWFYPGVLTIFIFLVVAGLGVIILPKYEEIFRDFATPLPGVTTALFAARDLVGGWLFLVAAALFWVILAVMILTAVYRRGGPFAPIDYLRDTALWRLPMASRQERDRGLADVCHLLAEGCEAGAPVITTLTEATQIDMNLHLRRRIRWWANALMDGAEMRDAVRRAGLPAIMAGLLGAARGAMGTVRTARFLGDYFDARFNRGVTLIRGAVGPAIVVALGLLVAWIAVAMIVPLATLIDGLAISSGLM
jgi:type II secretory pathway component PulF